MKFNMYGRTPRGKTPKWITIVLVSAVACLAAILLMVGIVISIELQSIVPALVIVFAISFFTVIFSAFAYSMSHSYIEITNETIRIVEYPFFKKREKTVLLSDIKKAKWRAGGRGRLSYLVFKNSKNKNLFHLDYVPEVIAYFKELGIEIQKEVAMNTVSIGSCATKALKK